MPMQSKNDHSRVFSNPQGIRPAADPLPADARPEIFCPDFLASDERLWVPQSPGVAFLPLCFGVTQGFYVNLLRVRRAGVLSCHRHSGMVHAHVLRGRWFYLEHDWMASAGTYLMESPGETHTLVVPDDVEEMVTWFHVSGGYVYLDAEGRQTGHEDVFTKIQRAREHYEECGIPRSQIDRLVR